MHKITFRYKTPIFMEFWKNGVLDPSQKIYMKRLAYLTYVCSLADYGCLQFSYCREQASKESGLSIQQIRTQEKFFLNQYFVKLDSSIQNHLTCYEWIEEKVKESNIIDYEKSTDKTESQVSKDKKEEIKSTDKSTDKSKNQQTNQQTKNHEIYERKTEKSTDKSTGKSTAFNKQINKETTCLKETNINKEKSEHPPVAGEDLSLFHKEKDLFRASKENELKEQKETLEAYIDMRRINHGIEFKNQITSKTIDRWLKDYSYHDILESFQLMLDPTNKKVSNPGGWVQKSLQEGWPKKERFKKKNQEFALNLKTNNKLHFLKINSRYCIDLRTEKDYYYHIDPAIFETQLRNCL